MPTRIYLTGFMGSGKSTVGPIVANVLGYPFLDLDAAVEARAGRTVQQLFAEAGEAAFRAAEADALRDTAHTAPLVVALGGGALAREDNLRFALQHGTVVYLRLKAETLAARLSRSPTERPLLHGPGGRKLSRAALRDRIAEMLAARRAFYEQAQLILDVDRQPVGQTVDAVVRALRRMP